MYINVVPCMQSKCDLSQDFFHMAKEGDLMLPWSCDYFIAVPGTFDWCAAPSECCQLLPLLLPPPAAAACCHLLLRCLTCMPALLYLSRTHNIMHRATFPEYIVGNIAYDQAVISIAARQGVHLIEATDTIHAFHQTVRKRRFLRHFILKMIILPRQARDKHREGSKTRVAFA
jgi:hypothetical protein